jgi:aminoglycoside 6'-N-acetyltransferase I
MDAITPLPIRKEDVPSVALLARVLWPEETEAELNALFYGMLPDSEQKVFVAKEGPETVGFIQLSVRNDHVEGTDGPPVAYVEGIYVRPEKRGKGWGRKLMESAEEWATEKGCLQLGSDTELDNAQSQEFHKHMGFAEVNRLVCYVKNVKRSTR